MRMLIVALLTLGFAVTAEARNSEYHLKLSEALESAPFKDTLGTDVAFYFGKQPTPKVVQSLGEFPTNQKANSFGRSDEVACRRALLDALVRLRDRARELGGNAVIGIVSYYQKRTSPSETEYECHAGALIAGVALRGTVVKLQR